MWGRSPGRSWISRHVPGRLTTLAVVISFGWTGISPAAPLDPSAYRSFPSADGVSRIARNPTHRLISTFDAESVRVTPLNASTSPWSLEMRLGAMGFRNSLDRVAPALVESDGNRISLRRDGIVEWYVNDESGLKQGFTIERPRDEPGSSFVLVLDFGADLVPSLDRDGRWIDFAVPGGRFSVLRYGGLHVTDAVGRVLDSRMEIGSGSDGPVIRLVFRTDAAEWPVTVDPLITGGSWSTEESDDSVSAAWGDCDGDGDLDLAIGNDGQPSRVYLNDGGTMRLSWSSPETLATSAVAWADWDGDGDLDLTIAGENAPIRLYANDEGALSSIWSSTELERTTDLAWADWDEDGDLDLAVGNDGQPNRIYRNEGGLLTSAWTSPESDATQALAWGDRDRDGDVDLFVGNLGEPNRVYENTSGALSPVWSSTESDDTRSIALGDWDGDSRLDFFAGNGGQPNRYYRNTGNAFHVTWSSPDSDDTAGVALGDWDGDGDLDLAVGNDGSPIRLWENRIEGITLGWTAEESSATNGIAWGDWDADGDLDLIAANRGEPNRVASTLPGLIELFWRAPWIQLTESVAWGDWDGDGDLDLAVVNDQAFAEVWRNTGSNLELLWSSPEISRARSVEWGDWDNDGDLDLLIGNWSEPIRIFAFNGLELIEVWASEETDKTTSVAWADWDDDGDLDFAAGNFDDPNRIYENVGGAMVLAWTSDEDDRTNAISWGDWDGDGDLDLAAGDHDKPVRVYSQTDGTMRLAWESAEEENTEAVAWGDWDGDGDLELAVGNHTEHNRIYENHAGTLTPVWESIEEETTEVMLWGDWDNDGDLDLFGGNEWESVRLYENSRGALATSTFAGGWDALLRSLDLGDFDNDGDLDLAAGNRCPVLENVIYGNSRVTLQSDLPETAVRPVATRRPGSTWTSFRRSSAERLDSPVAIPYRLVDQQGDPAERIVVEYSVNGGGQWFPATEGPGGSGTEDLAASRQGVEHVFSWDARADNACSDIATLRLLVEHQAPSVVGGPIQRATIGTQTPPFRVGGGPTSARYVDLDGDGFGDPATRTLECWATPPDTVAIGGDCDDTDGSVHAGATEINDGIDNHCPGDGGHGLADEVVGGFHSPDPTDLATRCWNAQPGATGYAVMRSVSPDFAFGCRPETTGETCAVDTDLPREGAVFYYLVRSTDPNPGSWGANSSGDERTGSCLTVGSEPRR